MCEGVFMCVRMCLYVRGCVRVCEGLCVYKCVLIRNRRCGEEAIIGSASSHKHHVYGMIYVRPAVVAHWTAVQHFERSVRHQRHGS